MAVEEGGFIRRTRSRTRGRLTRSSAKRINYSELSDHDDNEDRMDSGSNEEFVMEASHEADRTENGDKRGSPPESSQKSKYWQRNEVIEIKSEDESSGDDQDTRPSKRRRKNKTAGQGEKETTNP